MTGVTIAVIQVFASTCSLACALPLPGGRCGPSTSATMGVAMTLRTIHAVMTLRPGLDHIEEPVHVADRLHRAAEAVDPAGGARDEALPAIVAGFARMKCEGDRLVIEGERARRVAARMLGAVRDAREWHDEPERRHRER